MSTANMANITTTTNHAPPLQATGEAIPYSHPQGSPTKANLYSTSFSLRDCESWFCLAGAFYVASVCLQVLQASTA
ncbi:hypothetical protein H257_04882 [Aphanomyces astaci]|uniref:Uncharacterized protein n=1 Tax=Aphanomyces astaci TaxID=112090 RepID=W4GR27_APHAT|nr:hypothetical protein H257_04882 [Aphanomyces astaci]ETV82170.1 hypothetical protein H257_04882 [Aphanomyces astaci]|eukprot:XP_009827839.1 hypothetical protein H257_04882 [Aphanomyces astaci]